MFDEDVKTLQSMLTPGSQVFVGQKVVDDEDKVTEEEQAFYQSRVGTLLYLTKHSRLDITNAMQELSKSMDGASKLRTQESCKICIGYHRFGVAHCANHV